ncbi:hypothetical protein AT3G23122 [Arabidopsis thaliana]|eukprot:NP_001336523.1 hypothetical protein AT3G23122 [Arabidopsis thaliana]
MSRME